MPQRSTKDTNDLATTRLSAFDAFFVAYQESSGILMQLGVEVELKGHLTQDDLDRMLRQIVQRWPPLGQRLHKSLFGCLWKGKCSTEAMLHIAKRKEVLAEWRNRPLDPFREPPFQLLWIANDDRHLLAFRAHHAVVDGEGFFAICAEAVRALAGKQATDFTDNYGSIRHVKVSEAVRNLQRLRKESRSNQSARLAVRSCAPGAISIVERDLENDDFRELQQRATQLNVAPGWLCASAWMRAIHAWNCSLGKDTTSLISIEVPVSLRRRRDIEVRIGNRISPLTLYSDATLLLEDLAKDLKQQMSQAMRQRLHLALPRLFSPAKYLPMGIFCKLASNPELTGFATSHFAWFEQVRTIHDEIFRASNGALQIVDQQIYTPVCLHMGAALAVLAWPERAQIFLTHRLTAFSTSDARMLMDLVVQELGSRYPGRRQVAV